MCETLRRGYQGAVAAYAAQEGRKKNFRQIKDSNLHKWFYEVPGLKSELELLAWTHSSTLTSQSDFDGSRKQVRMMPRSFWDEDPRFLDTFAVAFREGLQRKFSELAFYPEKRYVCKFTIKKDAMTNQMMRLSVSAISMRTTSLFVAVKLLKLWHQGQGLTIVQTCLLGWKVGIVVLETC